jgi:hypothetical protein
MLMAFSVSAYAAGRLLFCLEVERGSRRHFKNLIKSTPSDKARKRRHLDGLSPSDKNESDDVVVVMVVVVVVVVGGGLVVIVLAEAAVVAAEVATANNNNLLLLLLLFKLHCLTALVMYGRVGR